MIKEIAVSTAFYGGGVATQKKLFTVEAGDHQGRTIAVYPKSQNQIVFTWSDPPFTSWASEAIIVSDSADYPACACMDDDGNVYVFYTVQTSLNLAMMKLSLSDGAWSVGSVNTVYNGDANYFPSAFKDIWGRLWVSFTRENGGSYYINVKRSTDDGAVWGTGPSDPGTSLTSGSDSCYSQLCYRPNHVYCFYTEGGTKLAYRRMNISGAIFEDEVSIFNGSGLTGGFSSASSEDLRLGIAFCTSANLYYREFDGSQWSGMETISSSLSVHPNLYFRNNVPYVIFGKQAGPDQHEPYFTYREGASFLTPQRASAEMSLFGRVLCFRPSAASMFCDKTTEAASETQGDVYHSDSNALLKDAGDAIFFGQGARFTTLSVSLSATGAGGDVSWYYWDGSDWKAFTPDSGSYSFDNTPATIRLFADNTGIPSDWQTCVVDGESLYWIKAVASSDFAVEPVGSQLTGVQNVSYIIAG